MCIRDSYTFRATGSVQKFDGYLAAYQAVKEEEEKDDEGDAAGCLLYTSRCV